MDPTVSGKQLDLDGGQQPDIEDQRVIKPFYLLLIDLSKELMDHELQQAILLCSHQGLPADELKIDSPIDLLK